MSLEPREVDGALAPPALDPRQLGLLNRMATFWRQTSGWPPVDGFFVDYHELGEDFDALLESIPRSLWRRNEIPDGGKLLELTMAGLERSEGGANEVDPFLSLVRLAVSRHIADPDEHTRVTTDDLRAALGTAATETDVDRLGQFYIACWRGARSNPGARDWFIEARLEHVPLEHVRSGLEYVRHHDRSWPQMGEPEALHHLLLNCIYDAWHSSGQWPKVRDLVIGQRRYGDVLHLLDQVPRRYLPQVHLTSPSHDRYMLTIAGIALVPGRPELDLYAEILRTIALHFVESRAAGSLSAESIANTIGASLDDTRRVGRLLQYDRFSGVSVLDEQDSWVARSSRTVLSWKHITTFREYEAACAAIVANERQQRDQWVSNDEDDLCEMFQARRFEPTIADAAHDHFLGRKFRNAVLDASIALQARIRERTELNEDGEPLMDKVFSPDKGFLRLGDSQLEVRRGWMFLFKGSVKALRNPPAHTLDELTPADALDRLSLLNLLYCQQELMTKAHDALESGLEMSAKPGSEADDSKGTP